MSEFNKYITLRIELQAALRFRRWHGMGGGGVED